MRVNDLLIPTEFYTQLQILTKQCSQFFAETEGRCLLKSLPTTYENFHKVKVRKRKKRKNDSKEFAETFNEAFEDELTQLRERAIFTNGVNSFERTPDRSLEPFYIFPIDGYKYMYSKEVENSSEDYKNVFSAIFSEFGYEKGNEIAADLLKFSYTSTKLCEGIDSGAEIILFNIPYFYAIRQSFLEDYNDILETINKHKQTFDDEL